MSRVNQHSCQAMVVHCIDFRFQKMLNDFLESSIGEAGYDRMGVAGVTKDLNLFMAQLEISHRLHHIKQVVIIHHENCGAYGEESTPQKHNEELIKAKTAVSAKYPDLEVKLYFLKLNGDFVKIS